MSDAGHIPGLGGRGDFLGAVPNLDVARLKLNVAEMALLRAVGKAATVGDLITRSGLDENRAIALLLSLRAKGAVVPAKVTAPTQTQVDDAVNLEEVDLEPDRKKEILELDRMLDKANLFELLGLREGASPEDVKKKFYEASRRYHPDRFFGKNLGSFRSRVDRIFRKFSEAHQTLTDPDKRAQYLKEHPELLSPKARAPSSDSRPSEPVRPKTPEDLARESERRARLLKHPYRAKQARTMELMSRARANMAKGDFGTACNDLNLVTQIDDQNSEAKAMLAEARRKHEVTRGKLEAEKGAKAEEFGDKPGALVHFRAAAGYDPQNAAAAFHTARLIMHTTGDAKDANVFASKAVEVEPANAKYRLQLAGILEQAGMKAMARKHFEEAARLDPDNEEVKKRVKKGWPF